MPRRSRSAAKDTSTTPETRRTTRGSIAKPDESPVAEKSTRRSGRTVAKKTPSPSPSRDSTPSPAPAKRGGRSGRAASNRPVRAAAGRGRGKKTVEESEEESDEDEEAEEEEFVPSTTRGKGRGAKTIRSPRGRSRGAKSPATPRRKRKRTVEVDSDEDEEEEWDPEEAEVKKKATPVKSSRPQRSRRSVTEPEESPSRRSSRRAAARTASAFIEAQAAQDEKVEEAAAEEGDEEGQEEEQPESSTKTGPIKRAIEGEEDEASAPAEKKARVEESKAEAEEKEEKEEEEAKENKDEGTAEDTTDQAVVSEGKTQSEEAKAEAMEADEAGEEEKEEEDEQIAEEIEEAEADKTETTTPEESAVQDEAEEEVKQTPADEVEPMETETTEEKVDEDSVEKSDNAQEAAVTEAADTTPVTSEEPVSEDHPDDPAAASGDKDREPDMSEYVVVSADDVPPADSDQVTMSAPPEQTDALKDDEPSSSCSDATSAINNSQNEDGDVSTSTEVSPPPSLPSDEKTDSGSQPDSSCTPVDECATQQTGVSSSSNGLPPAPNEIQDKEHLVPTSNSFCNSDGESGKGSDASPFHREVIYNPAAEGFSIDDDKAFSIASYNILADCHAQRDYTYEGVWLTGEQLSLQYRHQLIMKELEYLNSDVVCLQEVGPEHFYKMLVPSFRELGFEGAFIKRADDAYNEGEATFYRTSRFDLVSSRGIELAEVAQKELENSGLDENTVSAVKSAIKTPAVAVLTQLRCRRTNACVSVANVHNMWDRFARQDLQSIMVASAVKELVNMAGGKDQPHIICGDFNSWPGSAVYQLTQEGYLNDSSMAALNNAPTVNVAEGKDVPLVNLWWKGFQHTSRFKSAYATVTGEEPISSKFPHDGVMRAVDFIWYAGMEAIAVAKMTSPDAIKDGAPNAKFPSDHLSAKAIFSLK